MRTLARRLVLAAVCLGVGTAGARAQVDEVVGEPVTRVAITIAGTPTDDVQLMGIVSTRPGQPLSMLRVRETIARLFSLGRFDDVRVSVAREALGVALTYELVPERVIDRIDFRGELGEPARRLRQEIAERVGRVTSADRVPAVVAALDAVFEERGYLNARVTPRVVPRPEPDRAHLVLDIAAGRRATVGQVDVVGDLPASDRGVVPERLALVAGRPWHAADLERRVERLVATLRAQGYYEATVTTTPDYLLAEGRVNVRVDVERGPLVRLRFEGDALPADRLADLVPVVREGSVDEDLLEDSKRRIEDFLRRQGYWRALVEYERIADDQGLSVVFSVSRGRPFTIARVEIEGVSAVTRAELEGLLTSRPGVPFVEAALDRDADLVRAHYQRRGFTAVRVDRLIVTDAMPPNSATDFVVPRLIVTEGDPRRIAAVRFEGVREVPEADLRAVIRLTPGAAFNPAQVATDRQSLLRTYLNRGYADVVVEVAIEREDTPHALEVVYRVSEGDEVRVDQVIVVGNRRTSLRTIQREVLVEPGQPLGLDALVETRQRLSALGLFRRVSVDDVPLPGRTARDVLIDVEEAPATTIGYGAGIEGGRRLRRAADDEADRAVEQLEFAPRGFFEASRRNLWGKNRSITFFSRASLRRGGDAFDDGETTGFGLNEYRVLATFREPRAFGTAADAQVSAVAEQAIRSSFNFRRQLVNAEISRRIGRDLTVIGRYGFSRTDLFAERYNPEDQPLIDRLFPQVRLSTFSGALVRDTRDDALDPRRGTLVGAETELAARGIGSEVGYAKGFWQGFGYRRLPGTDRVVFAAGARVGLATGFAREVVRLGENGQPVVVPGGEPLVDIVKDVPASERFYAGGDTTIRGFALDRVGAAGTIDQDGFPTGGNALFIANAELRFPLLRALGGVAFVDAGNVFLRASEFDPTNLRVGVGLGLRYRSPIGPVRFDAGWKLDPQVLPSGSRERRYALHLSIGQAF